MMRSSGYAKLPSIAGEDDEGQKRGSDCLKHLLDPSTPTADKHPRCPRRPGRSGERQSVPRRCSRRGQPKAKIGERSCTDAGESSSWISPAIGRRRMLSTTSSQRRQDSCQLQVYFRRSSGGAPGPSAGTASGTICGQCSRTAITRKMNATSTAISVTGKKEWLPSISTAMTE
jgi:hypothetical protein